MTTEPAAKQLRAVQGLKASLRALVAALEPDAVFVFDAPALWSELGEVARLAQAGMTLLARRLEDACSWRGAGFRSAAEQLASVSGTSVAAANAMLETSRRVAELPGTADALRSGVLSAGKAELVAGAAVVVPEAEGRLLALALAAGAPLARVRDECLRARAAVDRDAAYARLRRERSARVYTDAEGAWHLHARGTVDDGAVFGAVFGPIVGEYFKVAHREGRPEPTEPYAFDALIELARRAGGAGAGKRRSPRCTVEGCTRTRRIENDHRYEWVKTRRTRVDETDPLCGHHHDLKTYDNWALVRGTRPLVPPDDHRRRCVLGW